MLHFYATFNELANLLEGDEGSPRGWKIRRFPSRAERDEFVEKHAFQRARAITRKRANYIWRDTYLCRGLEPPVGGLFYQRREFGD